MRSETKEQPLKQSGEVLSGMFIKKKKRRRQKRWAVSHC